VKNKKAEIKHTFYLYSFRKC